MTGATPPKRGRGGKNPAPPVCPSTKRRGPGDELPGPSSVLFIPSTSGQPSRGPHVVGRTSPPLFYPSGAARDRRSAPRKGEGADLREIGPPAQRQGPKRRRPRVALLVAVRVDGACQGVPLGHGSGKSGWRCRRWSGQQLPQELCEGGDKRLHCGILIGEVGRRRGAPCASSLSRGVVRRAPGCG